MSERYLDDDMLIKRAQSGDRGAIDTLIRKHEARAYQFAYRLCRNQEEACDIVGDAFVRVYNALPNFKGQSAFTTWLFRILTNCYLDHRKRDKNRPATSLEAAFQSGENEFERQVESPTASPHEETERSERGRRIDEAISHLPEYQRAMIVMYHAEMMSYEEISAALDMPIGTIKSRLNRARIALRQRLVRDEELFKLG